MSLAPCDPDSLGVYDAPAQPGLYPSETKLDANSSASASLSLSASWYAGSSSAISSSWWRSGNMAAMAAIVAGSTVICALDIGTGTALVGAYVCSWCVMVGAAETIGAGMTCEGWGE